jgi:hypothetical protein
VEKRCEKPHSIGDPRHINDISCFSELVKMTKTGVGQHRTRGEAFEALPDLMEKSKLLMALQAGFGLGNQYVAIILSSDMADCRKRDNVVVIPTISRSTLPAPSRTQIAMFWTETSRPTY